MPSLWYVGVGLEIVSTMSGTVGKQLIRFSQLRKDKNRAVSSLSFYVGLLVNTLLGPVIDMGAYSFAAQSLIAPFGGMDVVWNALLAPYTLNEKLTWGRAAGCVFIVAGTSVAGAFGNHQESEYTLQYIQDTLLTARVLAYCLAFVAWFLFNVLYLQRFPHGSTIRGLSLGCTAGTIAGNMFCVKAAIELIQRSIHEQDASIWAHWLPYAMLFGAVFFAVSNVGYMTKGLQEYEALFMVTIYEGSMIVSGCLSGAVVLCDLRDLESWRIALYGLGVLTIVFGMYVIFSQEAKQKSSLAAGVASIDRQPSLATMRSQYATITRETTKEDLREVAATRSDQKRSISKGSLSSASQRDLPGACASDRKSLNTERAEDRWSTATSLHLGDTSGTCESLEETASEPRTPVRADQSDIVLQIAPQPDQGRERTPQFGGDGMDQHPSAGGPDSALSPAKQPVPALGFFGAFPGLFWKSCQLSPETSGQGQGVVEA